MDPALAIIGGGIAAAAVMTCVGAASTIREGIRLYRKARVLAESPIFTQVNRFSMLAASFQARGEDLTALLARAFAALERIAEAVTMLRDLFRSPLRAASRVEAYANRVQNPDS